MKSFALRTLRQRMIALMVLAMLPASAIITYDVALQYREETGQIQQENARLAEIAVSFFRRDTEETRKLLESISKIPLIGQNAQTCTNFLANIRLAAPAYRNFGVALPDGRLVCSAVPLSSSHSLTDRYFFRRALTTRAFAMGEFTDGTESGQPSTSFGRPILDGAGHVIGIVFATLNVLYSDKALIDTLSNQGATLAMFNDRGLILAHYPEQPRLVGKTMPQMPLIHAALSSNGSGVADTVGLEGIRRLQAFNLLYASPEHRVFLVIGVDPEITTTPAKQAMVRHLVTQFAAIITMLAIIWIGYTAIFFRSISGMSQAAERIREGDLSARSGMHGSDQLGMLGATLDIMAESLENCGAQSGAKIEAAQRTIEKLEGQVAQQGAELQMTKKETALLVDAMQRSSSEMSTISEMSGLLQTCRNADEANKVVAEFAQQVLPSKSGGLFIIKPSRHIVDASVVWGQPLPANQLTFAPEDCWALRGGKTYLVDPTHPRPYCQHVDETATQRYLCAPLVARGETIGVLHVRDFGVSAVTDKTILEQERQARLQLVQSIAERTALALANLKLNEALLAQSIHDPLTGLYNRRYMEDFLTREELRIQRTGSTLGIIMIDVDHFKTFNDTHGHHAGDMLLRELGRFLRAHTRGADIACRYGGEEFVVIMPDASLESSRQRAEELRKGVAALRLKYAGTPVQVTASLGVATLPEHGTTHQLVLRAADSALYLSKQKGRNRVTVAAKG